MARVRDKLNDPKIRKARGKEKPYKLSDGAGMYLLVTPASQKYWRLKYRFGGKEKTLALGVYPDVKLAAARKKRQDARELLDAKKDPGLAKKEAKRQEIMRASNTFEGVAREWHEQQRHRVQRSPESGAGEPSARARGRRPRRRWRLRLRGRSR